MRKKKQLIKIILACFYAILIATMVIQQVPILFALVLLVFSGIVVYALLHIQHHIALFSFSIAFFTFLLGRETFYLFFKTSQYRIFDNPAANTHTYTALLLSLVSLFGAYYFTKDEVAIPVPFLSVLEKDTYRETIQKVARIAYFVSYPFLLYTLWSQIREVMEVGYVAYYQAGNIDIEVPGFIAKIALFAPMSFYFYLATKPPKKAAILPIVLYIVHGLLTLLTGQRFPVIASMMLIIIYFVIRNQDEEWITKKHIVFFAALLPLAIAGLFLMDYVRLQKSVGSTTVFSSIFNFFSVQGGSINVIKFAYHFQDKLTDVPFYSFNSIISNILNMNPYHGNSVAHALNGTSLAHRMSPLEYGWSAYLSGRGVGTSFIAELYHDFSYIGVAVGSMVYGYLLKKIDTLRFKNPLTAVYLLAMISPLLLAPRGEFDGFIGIPFRRASVVIVVAILMVSTLMIKLKEKKGATDKP